jgi:hypothetical protein
MKHKADRRRVTVLFQLLATTTEIRSCVMALFGWLRDWWKGGAKKIDSPQPRPPLSPTCPKLDEALINLLIPSFFRRWNILPVERRGGRIIFACRNPLPAGQIKFIKFCTNREDFEFVWDPSQYPAVYAHFDELVAHYSWDPYTVDAMFTTE